MTDILVSRDVLISRPTVFEANSSTSSLDLKDVYTGSTGIDWLPVAIGARAYLPAASNVRYPRSRVVYAYALEERDEHEAASTWSPGLTNSTSILAESDATLENARPGWWDAVERQFSDLRRLQTNWNAYGAPALDRRTIEKALSLLGSIVEEHSPQPSVVPAAKGGVQLEWHTLKADFEIEVIPDGGLSVLFSDPDAGEEVEPEHVTEDDLRAFLRRTSDL